jgi:hypothetical protein
MCVKCAEDLQRSAPQTNDEASLEALRFVFAAVLEREVAAACMDLDVDAAIALWPSSLYGMLAASAIGSPAVWRRCSLLVDARFGDTVTRLQRAAPTTLVQLFVDGRDVLSTYELAGLLWVFLRRRDAELGFIAARLGAEMAVQAACRAGSSGMVGARHGSWLDVSADHPRK